MWSVVPSECFYNVFIGTCQASFITLLAYITQHLGYSEDQKFYNPHVNNDHFTSYDFIVVGAGSAGCVVANRLSEINDWSTLLLEAGDEEPLVASVTGFTPLLQNTSIDYAYVYQPVTEACKKNPAHCGMPRGKVMGGSSTINGMGYVRGNKQDFDDWANLGNRGWSWNDVLPYFKKSQDLRDDIPNADPKDHGTGGYLSVSLPETDKNIDSLIDSWKELGFDEVDYNSGNQVGVARFQYTVKDGARQSANVAFIRPIRDKRSNLTIRPKSQATKIIIDPGTKRAIGVEYISEGSKRIVFARKEVVVSAGALDSPRLLMLSGIGPTDELHKAGIKVIKDLPVGRNLQDHVAASAITLKLKNPKIVALEPIEDKIKDVNKWLNKREGAFRVNGLWGIVPFFQTSYETRPGVADMELHHFTSFVENSSLYNILPYYNQILTFTTLLSPLSRGWLELNKTDPTFGKLVIYPNFFDHPQDLKSLVEGLNLTKRFTDTEAFKNSDFVAVKTPAPECERFESDDLKFFECVAKT